MNMDMQLHLNFDINRIWQKMNNEICILLKNKNWWINKSVNMTTQFNKYWIKKSESMKLKIKNINAISIP